MAETNLIGLKRCTRCREFKFLDQFHNHKCTPDGKNVRCKECACQATKDWVAKKVQEDPEFYKDPAKREYQQVWRKGNPNKMRGYQRKSQLKTRYGLSEDRYNELFEFQNGSCAICGKHQSDEHKALSVDHNHNTGEVRGLLCSVCNLSLGILEDHLAKALLYIEEPPYASLG